MHSNVSHLIQSTNSSQIPVQCVIKLECIRWALLQLRQEQWPTRAFESGHYTALYSTPQPQPTKPRWARSTATRLQAFNMFQHNDCRRTSQSPNITLQNNAELELGRLPDPSIGPFSIDTINSTRHPACCLDDRLLRLIRSTQ